MYSNPHFSQICPSDIFHETIAEIVIASASELPDMTQEQILECVLQAMLMMAIPAGEC